MKVSIRKKRSVGSYRKSTKYRRETQYHADLVNVLLDADKSMRTEDFCNRS